LSARIEGDSISSGERETVGQSENRRGDFVAVVNQTLARRYWPHGDAIDHQIRVGQSIPLTSRWYPAFERYLQQLSGRVQGMGGDPGTIGPSGDGTVPGDGGHGAEDTMAVAPRAVGLTAVSVASLAAALATLGSGLAWERMRP
jgi:hypothetical protein